MLSCSLQMAASFSTRWVREDLLHPILLHGRDWLEFCTHTNTDSKTDIPRPKHTTPPFHHHENPGCKLCAHVCLRHRGEPSFIVCFNNLTFTELNPRRQRFNFWGRRRNYAEAQLRNRFTKEDLFVQESEKSFVPLSECGKDHRIEISFLVYDLPRSARTCRKEQRDRRSWFLRYQDIDAL